MAWWLEGAISRHFGWVRNSSEAIFCIFLESGKKKKKKISRKNRFFSEKNRFLSVKIGFFRRKIGFIGKNRFYRKKSAIFRRFFFFRFFHCKIFSRPADFRFFSEKSANFGEILFPDNRVKEKKGLILSFIKIEKDM